ncbi:MAG: hypothetical protein FJZ01_17660 [Candidatus Sericytochromatia bacterium]|nr:hypothetical protein [Candidatus Tanganyikabacteria bacterium]
MTTAAARSAPELLAEIGSWFARDPLVAPEYGRGAAEFFAGQPQPWYAPDERESNQAYGRCAEWFAYHRPSEVLGRTPFEHLLATLSLTGRVADRAAMIRFRGQVYDFFEILKATEREIVLRTFRADREYHLGGTPALAWLRKGCVILTRLYPWDEAFVMSPVVTQFSAKDRWLARFVSSHEGLDPQEVERHLFIDRRHPDRVLLPREEVERELADFYAAFGIKEALPETFAALARHDSPVDHLARWLPKLARRPTMAIYDLNDLGTLLMAYWHHTPRQDLGGQTAFELQRADQARYQTEILPRLTWKDA